MSNLQNILKKPIVKYLLLSLLIIPIIPINILDSIVLFESMCR